MAKFAASFGKRRRPAAFSVRLIAHTLLRVAVYGTLLFVPAWTLHWWRAWVLLALIFTAMFATRLWAFDEHDALLEERRRSPMQRGQPAADKLLVVAFVIVIPAYIAFIPLDVFHWHLLGRPPDTLSWLGLILCMSGCWLIALAFRENAFASATVKDPQERGQWVVDTGVYARIRHPLYSGVVLVLIGVALWLQSWAGSIASILPIAVVIARIRVEEKFLVERLAGYDAYAERVRRRLIPGVW